MRNIVRLCFIGVPVLLIAGCAATPPPAGNPSYGPLSFNTSGGGDFYFAQDGTFVPARLSQGAIEIDLKPSAFQVGYNGEQLNICLAQTDSPEIRSDPQGNKVSCLAGAMSGAHYPNTMLVYSGKSWSDGNTEFSDGVSQKTAPLPGYHFAYQVDDLAFIGESNLNVRNFRGTLYGYIVVYKQHIRMSRDIMPIRLVFK